jgi:hypothetical protein
VEAERKDLEAALIRLNAANNKGQDSFWKELKKQRPRKFVAKPSAIKNSEGKLSSNMSSFIDYTEKFYKDLGTTKPDDQRFDATHYKSVIKKLKLIEQATDSGPEELDRPWTEDELGQALNKIKAGAPGPDGVGNAILKTVFSHNTPILLELINTIWNLGAVPKIWRRTLKKPFHKKGDAQDLGNYRGIGLTCCLVKLIERMIDSRLRRFARKYNLISDLQGGFRKKRGCSENLMILLEVWYEAFTTKSPIWISFLDFKRLTTRYSVKASYSDCGKRR